MDIAARGFIEQDLRFDEDKVMNTKAGGNPRLSARSSHHCPLFTVHHLTLLTKNLLGVLCDAKLEDMCGVCFTAHPLHPINTVIH